MAELSLVPQSQEWHALRNRALNDLFFLADVVLGYGNLVPLTIATHRLMAIFSERKTGNPLLDDAHIRLVSVPRGVGKTTLITVARSIQLGLRNPDTAILIANERQENADAFLAEIKQQFETNSLLRALFPDKIPMDTERHQPWATTKVSLIRKNQRKEPTYMTIGVGGTVTGMHFDTIMCDDVISREAMENARAGSWLVMEKVNRWINQLRPLLNYSAEHYEICFTGTRWWMGDSYEHIERSFGYGEEPKKIRLTQELTDRSTQTIVAERVGDIAIFRRAIYENGACIFPEKYSDEDLAKIRVADPELFAANFLNQPASDITATFKSAWLRYYTWADPNTLRFMNTTGADISVRVVDLDVIISVDPAFTQNRGHSRQAIVVSGTTETGEHLILEATSKNQGTEALIGDILDAVRRFKPRKLLLERAGQQLAFIMLVRQSLMDVGLTVSIEEVQPGGRQKEVRIKTLEPFFQRGLIYLDRTQTHLISEYQTFPKGEYKDVLDALAYQGPFWRSAEGGDSPRAQQKVESELHRLYERMGRPMPNGVGTKDWRVRADGSRR